MPSTPEIEFDYGHLIDKVNAAIEIGSCYHAQAWSQTALNLAELIVTLNHLEDQH